MAPLSLQTPDITQLRNSLRQDRANLEAAFLEHGKASRLLGAHSRLIDQYLRTIWDAVALSGVISLIAVGGYGRAELYPKSDIDLLILLQDEPNETLQLELSGLIALLWDIGMEVGHSIRTVSQCLSESSDITVQTNLLDARLITGNKILFAELQSTLHTDLVPRNFYTAKVNEQQARHARFLEIDFNLEPNLKESPGGLRDLQTITWISRAAGLGTRWSDLAQAGLISALEARQIIRHDNLLKTLRIRLHYLAKRREDRLMFEFQTPLAQQIGIPASSYRRASEHLMQRYYRTRRAVRQFNTILIQNLRDYLFHETLPRYSINERFSSVGTLLDIRDEQLFEHFPEALFEVFLLLEKYSDLTDLTAKTLRAVWRAQHSIGTGFRRNPVNRKNFMEFLRQPRGVLHGLRRMNQYGILGKYIPAFGRIVGQMQHDLFHVYTVDEHILMVVRNLRRLAVPEFAHEHPFCSQLMSEFARPEVLYIAGLFHDIAKGRGGDHSQLGKKDALKFCKNHGLTSGDTDLIVWLVAQHLNLSATAQKKDISDPDVIATFASNIKNERYLIALYLLTVSDVRGTSPKVWNAWKAKLMEDLFNSTRRYLKDGKSADHLGEVRQAAANTLNLYSIAPATYQLFWAQLEDSYFLDHEAQEIAWHTRLLAFQVNSDKPIVRARLSRIGEGVQVLVYCKDQRTLFARICDFFARMNFTIVEAKIHTTQHGYALNSFQIMQAAPSNTPYRDIMAYIEYELAQDIQLSKPITITVNGRLNRQLKHFPINNKVNIETGSHGLFVLSFVAGDRPGLLAHIAMVLDQHQVRIHRAKVNTLGSRAEDVFWLSGETLQDSGKSAALLTALLEKV